MTNSWLGPATKIAAIFAFRMLGLFMLIPVFTLYANQLSGANPQLLGLALGSYGLTQGLLQIPFGMLSDRYGRKPIITIGLLLFASGSLLGTQTHSILGMILARTLQGSGAIGSVLIALLADTTAERDRTKAMALIGGTIGLSFSLAFVFSPSLAAVSGLTGIFYVSAGLAFLGLIILSGIPTPKRPIKQPISTVHQLKQVFCDPALLRLDAGIFFQHFILVASFYVLPMLVQHHIHSGALSQSWHFYLWVIVGSFLTMIPIILLSEKFNRIKPCFLSTIVVIFLSQVALIFNADSLTWLGLSLFLYFVAFNFLEANLPSLISKQANANHKGSALGVYSSSQFLGIFAGGVLAGLVYSRGGQAGVFAFNAVITLIWLALSIGIKITNARQS